jgi:general secretion pathway protein L
MPTSSATDPPTLLSFAGDGWLLVESGGGVAARGGPDEIVDLPAATRTALAVPGAEVTIHWLELAGGLTQAQAAGAARLMLADASAEGLADMHVAVGNPERDLTPVALVPNASMAAWVAGNPDLIVPASLLLVPPEDGLVRRDAGTVPDYRGIAAAFAVEPEIAELLVGEAPVRAVDEAEFEAGLAAALSPPVINLRQGAWARRRQWVLVDASAARRIGWLVLVLAVLSLVALLVQTMRYSSEANRLEDEAAALGARTPGAETGARFTPLAAILFGAIQAVPNVELGRLEYRPDGILAATVTGDTPATLQALRRQLETGGLQVQEGTAQPAGARPSAELLLRPS